MTLPYYKINKKDIFFIFIILILALSLRIAYFKDYRSSYVYPMLPYSDSYSYFLWAKDISSGDLFGDKAFMKWPLYAYFLAFLLKVSRDNIVSVYLFQYILGAINCVLIYFIGKRIFNEWVGFISALLCAWYGLFIFYDTMLMYNSFSLFLNLLLFLFVLDIQNNISKKGLFWIGIFSGICAITQANMFLFSVLAIAWILWNRRFAFGKLIYNFSLFVFGLVIVIGAVTLRNYLVEKDFVLVAGNMGLNYYLGNNPQGSGTFFCPAYFSPNQEDMFRDARIIATTEMKRQLKTSEISNFWLKKSMDFTKNNPKGYLKLLFKKINYLFSPQEFIHDMEYYYIKDKIRIFKIMFLDLKFILPFGFLGMFLSLKKLRETALAFLALITLTLSIVLFFVSARYRVAIVPFLTLFASYGIFMMWNTIKEKKYFKFGLLCTALIIIFAMSNYNLFTQKRVSETQEKSGDSFSHLQKAQSYISKSDYRSAMQELKSADKIEPQNRYVILYLGAVYYNLHNFKMAEEKFKELIRIYPLFVDAYYNLGLLYNQQQRYKEAEGALKKAVSLDPESAGAHFELGKAYKAKGNLKEARSEFNLALKKINRWRTNETAMIEKELAGLGE